MSADVRICIGDSEKKWEDVKPSWITHEWKERQRKGEDVWFKVAIKSEHVNITLATPNYPSSGGGGVLNDAQRRILDLWKKRGLLGSSFNAGNLIAFLNQLDKVL